MFFDLRFETGKRDMIRAVLEGICYHLRWLLECELCKVKASGALRFVGGGARRRAIGCFWPERAFVPSGGSRGC